MVNTRDAKDVLFKMIDIDPKNRSWLLSLIIILKLSVQENAF